MNEGMELTAEVKQRLQSAAELALAGEWEQAHRIAQDIDHALAHWLHAILHKREGDAWNSRYWYRRSAHDYEDYADSDAELRALLQQLR